MPIAQRKAWREPLTGKTRRRLFSFMSGSESADHRPVIMNATNIGSRTNGISNYTLSLIEEFSRRDSRTNPFIIYLNRTAEKRIRSIRFPEHFVIRWTTRLLSPDHGFVGHLLRLLYANYLSITHPKTLIFNTSQIEASFFRRNQIITVHDVIPLLFREHHRRQYFFFKYFLRFALRFANHVITPSDHTRILLRKIYELPAERVHVIPHGIGKAYRARGTQPVPEGNNYILFAGRIGPMKNIAAVIRAFHSIRDEIPHDLVIVGEGKEELRNEIRAGRLTRSEIDHARIIVKGYVSDDEMPGYFSRASLFVFPSLYEGFGLPPLEAISCGCPVIVSRTASLPEECGEAAYYVDPYSIASIARGMREILTDPRLRSSLVMKGFQRASIFQWRSSAREHLAIIRKASNKFRRKPPRAAEGRHTIRNKVTSESRYFFTSG